MKTKIILSLVLVLGIVGVLAYFQFRKQAPKSEVIKATFGCAENKTIDATFTKDQVSLVLSDGRTVELSVALSASGARYANTDETIVFWNKGDTAFIEENSSMTYTDCMDIKTATAQTSKTYTLDDVAKHAVVSDCWMVIENNVYDVTAFVAKHPGGKAILNGCGKDASELFNQRPTNGKGPHPATARELLPTYLIGDLMK